MSRVYTVSELREALQPVFARHGVRSAVLFGSYSKGQATERSDVDLLVDSGLRGLAFFGLLEGVVSALEVPVDLIDVSQIERGSRIEREIKRSGDAANASPFRSKRSISGAKASPQRFAPAWSGALLFSS